jgi:hypothetical protein
VSRPRSTSLAALSTAVLAEVEAEERVKAAEVEALRAATPRHVSDLGRLLHKAAEELNDDANDVTYDDLQSFAEGRL